MTEVILQVMEYVPIFLFMLLFIGVIFAEIRWLTRKGWATSGRATGYVLSTDMLGICLGSFVVFVIMLLSFMAVMGPQGRGSDIGGEFYIAAVILAVIVPPILLFFVKRIFLGLLQIKSGRPAWIYSAVSSIVIPVICLAPPPLLFFVVWKLSTWK